MAPFLKRLLKFQLMIILTFSPNGLGKTPVLSLKVIIEVIDNKIALHKKH
jgi:hypothetical protein